MLGRIQLQGEPGIGQAPTRCRAELSLCHCCSRAAPVLCSQCCAGLSCLHSCSQSFLLFLPVRLVLDRLLTKIPGRFLKDDVDTDKASSCCSGIEGGCLKEEKPHWDWDFLAHRWPPRLLKWVSLCFDSVSNNRKFAKSTKSPTGQGFCSARVEFGGVQDFLGGMALFSCPGSEERGMRISLLPTAVAWN